MSLVGATGSGVVLGRQIWSAGFGEKSSKIKAVQGPKGYLFLSVALKTALAVAKLRPERAGDKERPCN